MTVACIDTNMLIWGIEGVVRPGQEDMPTRALALFRQLSKDHVRVVVPSIVLAEFLLGIPTDDHARFQEIVNRRFMVVPYDGRAALHFATVWRSRKEDHVIQQMRAAGRLKAELRADAFVVATAMAAGAKMIYGHDDDVRRFANGFIPFTDIADVQFQTTMPLL